MKKIALVLLASILMCPFGVYGRTIQPNEYQVVKPADDIKSMFDNEQYREIIDHYAGKPRTLSAEELSYVARAYYQLEDFADAIKYVDMAIAKDVKWAHAYYVKGIINNAEGDYSQALESLNKAIALSSGQGDYYAALGDLHFAEDNYTEALSNYRKAMRQSQPSEKAYYMIGAVFAAQDNTAEALDAFYAAKSKIAKDKELYVNVLYNIGMIESDNGDRQKAANAYKELIEYFPDDYYTIEKLVQCCNILGQYDGADMYKSKLYKAYNNGELQKTSLLDMFRMDYLTENNKNVLGYERYEEPSCTPFVKHIFYVSDGAGEIDSTIFMEYIPATDENEKGNYKPIMRKGDERFEFSVIFDQDVKYATIRPYIVDIASGKTEGVLVPN